MLGRRVAVLLRLPASRLIANASVTAPRIAPFAIISARRAYSTPVGEPTKTVKRATRKNAAGSAAKAKVAAKKKKAAPKKAKKPARKVYTAEEKTVRKAKKSAAAEKKNIAELKVAALSPPKVYSVNAYHAYMAEQAKNFTGNLKGKPMAEIREHLSSQSRARGAEWKSMTPAEVEHYNHISRTRSEQSRAEYKRYVESYKPEEIFAANRARTTLRRKFPIGVPGGKTRWPAINDERAAKNPTGPYMLFTTDRTASGDFKNIKTTDRSKLIGQEWKALDQNEKEKYVRLAAEDRKRFVAEFTEINGFAPGAMPSGL